LNFSKSILQAEM
jgi:hypothetical protein